MSFNNREITLSKDYIRSLRESDDIATILNQNSNSGNLVFILENLNFLPSKFNAECIIPLLYNKNDNVRFEAVRVIGRLKSEEYLDLLCNIVENDISTMVKREAVSSIGRLRSSKAIPVLKAILNNEDPKILCQAIRGLLVFKGDKDVDDTLKSLKDHDNETVRKVIEKEYFKAKSNTNSSPHIETLPFLRNVIINDDVLKVLKYVPDESFHLTFTSPPYYNARDYSIYPSYEAYLEFLSEVFKEVYRVTKEGRFLIVNTSPIIVPRISRAHSSKRYPIPFDLHPLLTKMGWEFIDDIVWEKPEFSVKNRIGGFQQHRKPLAYKPNSVTEYLMVYRKQTDKLLDWNIRQYDERTVEESKVKDGFETTNVWKICPKSDKIHSAIFPIDLCKRVIQYYSFKGDLIFDPFAGSGTLGRTAQALDRYFFLTEKEPKYFEYMKSFFQTNSFIEKDNTRFETLDQFKEAIK